MKSGMGALAARLTVTTGLLGLLVIVVADPREIAMIIANAKPVPMVAAVALSAADRVAMAYKWWLLLRARRLSVGLWIAVRCYFASSLYGLVLPVTVGADAVRIVALRQLGMLEVAASIVIERWLGVIAMASVSVISCLLLATTVTEFAVQSIALWLLGGIAVALGLFVTSLLVAERWAIGRTAASSRLRKAAEAYSTYRRHPGALAVFYGLSVAESLMSAVVAYVVAIGLGIPLPLYVCVATVPLALASARLPISLGGFGVQEASFVFLAGLAGISSANSLSIMLVMDLAMLVALLPSVLDGSMLTLRRQAATERVV